MPKTKKRTSPRAKSKVSASSSTDKARPLAEVKAELQAVHRGEIAPSRSWELLPDGKGGFVRRQIDPEQARQRNAAAYVANETVVARQALGLSQADFAALLGISKGTLQGWEQGRRKPNRAALVLLQVAKDHPGNVLKAARAVGA